MSEPCPLSSLCQLIVDCEHKTAPIATEGYPSIRTPNVGRGRLILEGANQVSESTYIAWTRRAVPQENDLVIAREAPVGNVAIIPAGTKICLGQRTVLVRPDPEKVVPGYLCYFLLGDYAQQRFHSTSIGSTVAHLNMKDIRSLPVPKLPPLETQRRIASILGAYDDLIEVNRRRVAVLEAMARGLFEEWFVRFRFPGHESVQIVEATDGPMPEGWAREELGELIDLAYGKALKATERVPGPFPVIGSSGVVGNHIEPYQAGPGIVVGRKGNVGSIIWSAVDFWPIDTVYFVRSKWPLMFLLHLLRRVPFQNTDAAVPGLNRSAALKKVVTVPQGGLPEAFERRVQPLQRLIDQLRVTNEGLTAGRDLLLPRLISGQLSVEAAERELEQAA